MSDLTITALDAEGPRPGLVGLVYLCDLNGNEITGQTALGTICARTEFRFDADAEATLDLPANDTVDQDNTYWAIRFAGDTFIILKSGSAQTLREALVDGGNSLGSAGASASAVAAEAENREAGDAALQAEIDALPGGGGAVDSVNSQTGDVVLTATDVGADPAGAATAAVTALVAGAPGALDTLDELAAALNDDANYAATIVTALAAKATNANLIAEIARASAAEGVLTTAQLLKDGRTNGKLYDHRLASYVRGRADAAKGTGQMRIIEVGDSILDNGALDVYKLAMRQRFGGYPSLVSLPVGTIPLAGWTNSGGTVAGGPDGFAVSLGAAAYVETIAVSSAQIWRFYFDTTVAGTFRVSVAGVDIGAIVDTTDGALNHSGVGYYEVAVSALGTAVRVRRLTGTVKLWTVQVKSDIAPTLGVEFLTLNHPGHGYLELNARTELATLIAQYQPHALISNMMLNDDTAGAAGFGTRLATFVAIVATASPDTDIILLSQHGAVDTPNADAVHTEFVSRCQSLDVFPVVVHEVLGTYTEANARGFLLGDGKHLTDLGEVVEGTTVLGVLEGDARVLSDRPLTIVDGMRTFEAASKGQMDTAIAAAVAAYQRKIIRVATTVDSAAANNTQTVISCGLSTAALEAGTRYRVKGYVRATGPNAGDIRFQFIPPSGATQNLSMLGPATTIAASGWPDIGREAVNSGVITCGCDATVPSITLFDGELLMGSAGTWELKFAQSAATVGDTLVLTGSWFTFEKIS